MPTRDPLAMTPETIRLAREQQARERRAVEAATGVRILEDGRVLLPEDQASSTPRIDRIRRAGNSANS